MSEISISILSLDFNYEGDFMIVATSSEVLVTMIVPRHKIMPLLRCLTIPGARQLVSPSCYLEDPRLSNE